MCVFPHQYSQSWPWYFFFDEFIGSAYREETFAFLLVMSFLAWLIEKRICIDVRFVHKVMAQT
jgi:hypothetical protein